jgi:hypothetical protein
MVGAGHFDDYGLDHRHVRSRGDFVIQKAGIEHIAPGTILVALIQSPADTLDGAALHLALDVTWVDGFANVLDGSVAQDVNLSRLRIDLHVHDVRAESPAPAPGG